jgi:hypothetical protein
MFFKIIRRISDRKSLAIWVSIFSIWVIFFIFLGLKSLDPDFGWHLRVGQITLEEGIPEKDPFSYTTPSYPYVDHAWLTDVIVAKAYELWGYDTLALGLGLLMGVLFLVLLPPGELVWGGIPMLLAAEVFWSRNGIRPQIIDWVFFALFLKIIWQEKSWQKWRWIIPIIFGIWANLHGGFALGLAVLSVILIVRFFEKRRLDVVDIVILILGVAATLVNPYGLRLWYEVWLTVSDTELHSYIVEWLPFWTRLELGIWFLFAMTAGLISFNWRKMEKWKIVVFFGMTFGALSSLRHGPLLAIVAILIIEELMRMMYKEHRGQKLIMRRARKFMSIILIIVGTIFLSEFGIFWWGVKSGVRFSYPDRAIKYLREQNFSGQVFSEYGWGGFLIWQYPEKKVFIDGRMTNFHWQAPTGESSNIFEDYRKVVYEGEFEEIFEKFEVKVVLWPNKSDTGKTDFKQKWLRKLQETVLKDDRINLVQKLENSGWERKYEDEVAVILVKK